MSSREDGDHSNEGWSRTQQRQLANALTHRYPPPSLSLYLRNRRCLSSPLQDPALGLASTLCFISGPSGTSQPLPPGQPRAPAWSRQAGALARRASRELHTGPLPGTPILLLVAASYVRVCQLCASRARCGHLPRG
eukprot:3938346-Rhodomonas_salina.1